MRITKQNMTIWLFIGFLLLGGIANLLSRSLVSEWGVLMTSVNYLVYISLLLFWLQSVRKRLLPSGARTCVISAALLMLLYMLLRIIKYRILADAVSMRYCILAYWIPQMLVPALFLMTCIRIRRGGRTKKKDNLLLIPAAVLSLIVLTNDLHSLVYVPNVELAEFSVSSGTYTYGPVLYLLYGWMVLTVVLGIIILFRETGHISKKAIRMLICVIAVWFGLVLLNILVLEQLPGKIRFFNIPEVHTFGMLGVFEICIRYRLIPYNENYSGFFRNLRIPAIITDKLFHTVYHTESALSGDQDDLKNAVIQTVELTPDQKLYGKEIRAGYAFWVVDESGIHRVQERLKEANEIIEQENDLILAETEQKEKDAFLQSRHRIYHEIAEELYPCQKRVGQILDQMVPGTENFHEQIAEVSVLNAYIKRKTNLLLLASEKETLPANELFLALQESSNYLTLAGLQTTAMEPEEAEYTSDEIIKLYDSFELIAEQLMGRVSSLMVSWSSTGLRLAAESKELPDTEMIPLPVEFKRSEDILYMDIRTGKGGEAV